MICRLNFSDDVDILLPGSTVGVCSRSWLAAAAPRDDRTFRHLAQYPSGQTPPKNETERLILCVTGVCSNDGYIGPIQCQHANVTDRALTLARTGDENAFRELTDPYQHELQLHCYRIVGSTQDAEDLVQETLLAAWRRLGDFNGRASIRTWLYRIATNRCIDALRASSRRPQSVEPMSDLPQPSRVSDPIWLQPYPDVLLDGIADLAPGPDARYEAKESIGLAFVAGLQHLPPQQRAVLVLRDVLSFQATEVAEMLGTTPAAVNSLLRRARLALDSRLPAAARERAPLPNSPREREVIGRFAEAVEAGDVDGVLALLTDDAWVRMPPQPYEYQGAAAIGAFLHDRETRRGAPWLLVPTRANGQPAFGCYFPCPQTEIARPHGLLLLTLAGSNIAEITWFADTSVFPHFGLPRMIPKLRA
jgi:RNA polymerase sigma-70 factor (TIGR02960 family)